MRFRKRLWFGGVLLAAIVCAQQTETKSIRPIAVPRKVALVIGNSRYQHVPVVSPAGNDADDMAQALRDLHFDLVVVQKDLGADALVSAVSRFARTSVQPGDLALVYYSGHGGQVGEENYLLPVDYDPPSDEELVERRAYRMSELRDTIERTGARVRVLIFDACRDSPVTTSKSVAQGLRGMEAKPEGTLVAYASAHNQVARYESGDRNSFYTAELLTMLRRPQMDLKAVFENVATQVFNRTNQKQVPYLYGFLSAPLYLNGVPDSGVTPAPQAAAINIPVGPAADVEAWESIRNSTNRALFDQFLTEYPSSQYAGAARLKIASLTPLPAGPGPTPPSPPSTVGGSAQPSLAAAVPKVRSTAEAAAIKKINDAKTPDERIAAVDALVTNFAGTTFKAAALVEAANAADSKGDYVKAVAYGDMAIQADPMSFYAMLLVAGELAQHTAKYDLDKEEKLNKAEKYIAGALTIIPNAQKPSSGVSDSEWNSFKVDQTAAAHRDLGLVAAARGRFDLAAEEYRSAIDMSASPDTVIMARLSNAYNETGHYAEALSMANRVLSSGNLNPTVRTFANQERSRAEKGLGR